MITLYGIKNCDTVRKAKNWLDTHGIDYQFHDFRQEGLSEEQVIHWLEKLPLEKLINKRSTTWKQLDQHDKDTLSVNTAPALCAANVTLIKRPLLNTDTSTGTSLHLGFSDKQYQDIFQSL